MKYDLTSLREATVNQVNQLADSQNYHAKLTQSDRISNLSKLKHAHQMQLANNKRLNKINQI